MAEPTLHKFTAGDGYVWHYRHFAPAGSARATIVTLHGIQSHGSWYERSCSALGDAGYAVSFLDRRGCGLNQCDRGDAPSTRRSDEPRGTTRLLATAGRRDRRAAAKGPRGQS